MTRAEKRAIRRKLNKDIAEFIKIQNHYFPDLIADIRKVLDRRHQSYITYEIEVILYVMILKNVCSIESMQEMNEHFEQEECVKNIYRILGLEEKEYLPHYVTINECLSKLDTKELEKIRKGMIYNLIRKKSFDHGKFQGSHWLVIVDATQLFYFKERHCEQCLTKTMNKGSDEEKTIYYHPMGEASEAIVEIETVYKRKPKVKAVHHLKWVNDLYYKTHKVSVMELEIEKDGKRQKEFRWISSQPIETESAYEFAETGRKRWLIENEGFNIQKNHRYIITHANSLNYNAMKNHYLLTQIADVLVQVYENGIKDLRIVKGTIEKISESLLECLKKTLLTEEDLEYKRMQIRRNYS